MSKRWTPLLLVVAILVAGCGGDEEGFEFLGADATGGGESIEDLTVRYNRGLLEYPLEQTWFGDVSLCDAGMSTEAVYLAPSWPVPGDHEAECTMNADQALYLNAAGLMCIQPEGEDPCTTESFDEVWTLTEAWVTIDDEQFDFGDDRIYDTPEFEVDMPEGNLFEVEAMTVPAMARGLVVLVEGLDPGVHEVVIHGDFDDGGYAGSLNLTLTVEE